MAAASGYDAFISYSHEHDRVLGPRLQSGLQRFAKPWYRMRALRIFRDTTDLTAGLGLWSSIDEALQESRWFILLASPEAAGSSNVDREVQWWLDHRSVDRLIVVGTAVGLAWDERHGDWAAGAPVPRALRGAFGSEPIWVDLSDVASSGQTARIPDDRLAEVAAPIRGVRKDALVGEHLRQRRRVMQLAGGTIAFLLALAVGLAAVSVLAVRARDESDRQRDMAVSRLLYIQSQALSDAHPMLARQESIASWRINPSVQARYAMLNAAASPGGTIFTARGLVDGLAFSSGSGTLLSASINGTVQRWDVATGQQIGRSLQTGNAGFLDSEPFTPDARITAGLGPGSTLRLWDPATRHLTGRPLAVNPDTSWVALSAGGTVAVTGTSDSLAQVWDVATGQQIGSNLKVHPLALSPDGRILAAGDGPGAVQLWNTETGKPIGGPLETKLATPTEAVFSPDGGILAVGSYYNVLLFNVATHTLIGSPLVSGWVQSLAISRNGAVLAAGCNDGTVMLWNVTTQQQMGSTLTGENSGGPVQAVAFSPDGALATGSYNGTIRLWDVGIQQPASVPMPASRTSSVRVLNADGKTWATESSDGTFQLWDVATRRPIGVPFAGGGVNDQLLFSFNGKYLVALTKSSANPIQLWDLSTGHKTGFPVSASAMAISRDGKTMAMATSSGTVQLWDVATRRPMGSAFTVSPEVIYSLAFSPDGRTLATGSNDNTARLWDVATHREIGSPLITSDWVFALAFSPDGKTLATGSVSDGTVRLWDVATSQQIGSTLDTGLGNVGSMAFSPDGKRLVVSGLNSSTIQRWDVRYLVNTTQYLCALVNNQSMTRAEWELNASGVPYQNTCP